MLEMRLAFAGSTAALGIQHDQAKSANTLPSLRIHDGTTICGNSWTTWRSNIGTEVAREINR